MILGVGLDIVEVERVRRAMQNPRFVLRVLTPSERERALTPAYVAGRWAAKEATAKCVPGLSRWQDVEVLTGEGGAPLVRLAPGLLAEGETIMLSITHERGHAAAVALRVRVPAC